MLELLVSTRVSLRLFQVTVTVTQAVTVTVVPDPKMVSPSEGLARRAGRAWLTTWSNSSE